MPTPQSASAPGAGAVASSSATPTVATQPVVVKATAAVVAPIAITPTPTSSRPNGIFIGTASFALSVGDDAEIQAIRSSYFASRSSSMANVVTSSVAPAFTSATIAGLLSSSDDDMDATTIDIPTTVTDDVYASQSPAPLPSKPALPFGLPVLIGIIVGGAVFFIGIAVIAWACLRQRRKRKEQANRDDTLGSDIRRERSRRHSRAGYRRSPESRNGRPPLPSSHLQPPAPHGRGRNEVTRAEARGSVQMPYPPRVNGADIFAPPSRSHPAFGMAPATTPDSSSSTWTDDSEMDVYAQDGSTIARTLSTVSRPNSEYDLDDPGSTTYHGTYAPDGSYNPYGSFRPEQYEFVTSPNQGTFNTVTSPNQGTFSTVSTAIPTYLSTPAPSSSGHGHYVPAPSSSGHGHFSPGATPTQSYFSHQQQMPPQQQGGRIPAPRLLVDTKAPIWPEDTGTYSAPPSALTSALPSAGPSGGAYAWPNASSTTLQRNGTGGAGTYIERAPSAASRSATPVDPFNVPYQPRLNGGRATPMGSVAPSPASHSGHSAARPLIQRAASIERPSALPYVTASRNASRGPSPYPDTIIATGSTSNLARGPTIIRHADAGAFEDAVPDEDEGELHLPPAYGDIYGPPAAR